MPPFLSSIQLINNFSTKVIEPLNEFPTAVEYLVIAGGGGGGGSARYWVNTYYEATGGGGGGGAGGLLQGTDLFIPTDTLVNVSVGYGGAGGVSPYGANGSNGQNTVLSGGVSLTAIGGGGGAKGSVCVKTPITYSEAKQGASGGSGGGSTSSSATTGLYGGSSTAGQGYPGGSARKTIIWSTAGWYGGAGGGGAGGAGGAAYTTSNGAKGAGLYHSISGSSTLYCEGGLGGYTSTSYASNYYLSQRGAGGPGARSTLGTTTGAFYGGGGGNGIVYIRYPKQYLSATISGNATETISGMYKLYRFEPGTSTFEFITPT